MSISPVPGSREENAVSRGTPVDQLRVICVRTATSPSINAAQAEVPLADLLRRVAGRDSQIFQQLYDRTAPQVYSTALAVVRDNHRADRITQQVYCDVWWRAAEFDASAGSVESWLSLLTRARWLKPLNWNSVLVVMAPLRIAELRGHATGPPRVRAGAGTSRSRNT